VKIRIIAVAAFCWIAAFLSLSCKDSRGGEAFREFRVKVDTTRLGAWFSAGPVALRVPRNWTAADSTERDRVRHRLSPDSGSAVMLSLVLRNTRTGSLMAVAAGNGAEASFERWTTERRADFQALHRDGSISEARFKVSGMPLLQLFAAESGQVPFRLLPDAQPRTTIEFFIPQDALGEDLRTVESSMGTIRKD
jgi:hypothetical protein